jgi:hypothetical protein
VRTALTVGESQSPHNALVLINRQDRAHCPPGAISGFMRVRTVNR